MATTVVIFFCNFMRQDGRRHIGTAISVGDGSFEVMENPASFTVQGETLPMAVGDANADGLSDLMVLDLLPCPV